MDAESNLTQVFRERLLENLWVKLQWEGYPIDAEVYSQFPDVNPSYKLKDLLARTSPSPDSPAFAIDISWTKFMASIKPICVDLQSFCNAAAKQILRHDKREKDLEESYFNKLLAAFIAWQGEKLEVTVPAFWTPDFYLRGSAGADFPEHMFFR